MHAKSNTQQWLAYFSGHFKFAHGRTQMGKTRSYGPLRVQRPFYPEGPQFMHLYLLHPPGGLVAGDKLSIDIHADTNAHLLMTTPSAGKLYRNITDLWQGQYVRITVKEGASVEWLPMENIVFSGAKGHLTTEVEIFGDGLFVGWEITCLGRPHCDEDANEMFTTGELLQTLTIRQDGQWLFKDHIHIVAGSEMQTGLAGLQGKSILATCVINRDIDFDYTEWQETIASQLKGTLAITQKPGVLIARYLGDHAEDARTAFELMWHAIRPHILNRKGCEPRIWRT